MMKKKTTIISAISAIICAAAIYMIATGFAVNTSVYITDDFTVSDDGGRITFTACVGSSMGYIRGYKDEGGGVKPHYLKFYSAWGGFNSPIGAKSSFTLELSPDDTEIYVYKGDCGYILALEKEPDTGKWMLHSSDSEKITDAAVDKVK